MDSSQPEGLGRIRFLQILPIIMILLGWTLVLVHSYRLEQSTISMFQAAQTEVVVNAANAVQVYIENEIVRRGEGDIPAIEREVLVKFVKPIRIGELGDAWIYAPTYVVFDPSPDFPTEYIGKSMAEIFALQKEHGASHYEAMSAAVGEGKAGTGWYVWEPPKGKEWAAPWELLTRDTGIEIAAWTPVVVFEGTDQQHTWVVGMSAILTSLMRSTGVYDQIQTMLIAMSVVTAVVIVLLYYLTRAEAKVEALQQEVIELHIQVDEVKRKREVSEIVDTDYFRDLSTRAASLRDQRRARASHGAD